MEFMHVSQRGCVIVRDGQEIVTSWRYESRDRSPSFLSVHVPAIAELRLSVVALPMQFYCHCDFSPEMLRLRPPNIRRLGWNQQSYDLRVPPEHVGTFNLFGTALGRVMKLAVAGESYTASRIYPNVMRFTPVYEHTRKSSPSFDVYFNQAAFEFYGLLFIANVEHAATFRKFTADVSTLAKMRRWAGRFEGMKRRQYERHGWSWNPVRKPITTAAEMDSDREWGKVST